jgi:hypothetical protein
MTLIAHRENRSNLVAAAGWESKADWSEAGGALLAWRWIHRQAGLLPAIQ